MGEIQTTNFGSTAQPEYKKMLNDYIFYLYFYTIAINKARWFRWLEDSTVERWIRFRGLGFEAWVILMIVGLLSILFRLKKYIIFTFSLFRKLLTSLFLEFCLKQVAIGLPFLKILKLTKWLTYWCLDKITNFWIFLP